MLISWFVIAWIVIGPVWAAAFIQVIREWVAVGRFLKAVQALPPSDIPQDSQDVPGEFGRLLDRFVNALRRAADSNSLPRFDVNRQATPLIAALRGATTGFRGVAGILILFALVVTLLNLQGAVSDLGSTFHQLSQHERASTGPNDGSAIVDRVQGMMGDVANTAATAFMVSGVTVFGAALLLVLAALLEGRIRKALRAFTSWAHELYAARIAELSRQSSGDAQADFSTAIGEFRAFVDSFGRLSSELSNLGEFRQQLAEAATSISDAVTRIPVAIGENINQLSSQVTREIAEDLRHQYEILNKMLMTYGDMGVNVKKLEEFIERMLHGYEQASGAMAKLGTLPQDALELRNAVNTLSARVDEIPALDIRNTSALLKNVSENVESVDRSIGALKDLTAAREDNLRADLEQVRGQVAAVVDSQKRLPEQFETLIQNDIAGIQERIDALAVGLRDIQAQPADLQKRGLIDLIRTRNRGS